MSGRTLEADYLVIGSGAAGMAFTDTLIAESQARVVMVDRRSSPGGHWNDAYPFVRLHQPSLYYGVNSLPLGGEAIETDGPEAGAMYERASGPAIQAYYARVMSERLAASDRVQFFPEHEWSGGRLVSLRSGESREVVVRKKVVDARFLSPNIPATTPPPFEVAAGASVIPVNALSQLASKPERFVIVGAGKTALDACVWLLQNGVRPQAIQWIKPRETWLINRSYCQPEALVASMLAGLVHQLESAARASSLEDLFDRLEATQQLLRVDACVRPDMYKGATVAEWEIRLLRQIEDVVRLGHVRRIERDRIVLDHGSVPTRPDHLHVHCAVDGLPRPAARPIFEADRVTLQAIRTGLVPFNAALVAFIEAHREDPAEQNRLCPPNPFPDTPFDWVRGTLIQLQADRAWAKQPDIQDWLGRARLNPTRALRDHFGDRAVQGLMQRFMQSVSPGVARMLELTAQR